MGGNIFNLFIVIFFFLQIVASQKLNVPRILLPIFNEFSSKFVLETTEGGCFKWTTTRSDLISLTLLEEDPDFCCSSKVVVASVNKEIARNIAIVLAEDVHTKQVLRCDVIVDVIDHLGLVTTTRELFMGEAPEAFEVRAFDSQGNEFTTLEGVEFNWRVECVGPNSDTILQFITFIESPYDTPPTIIAMESQNKQGHIVLLEGIKTGNAQLFVSLPYSEYSHVEPYRLQLSVIANFIIDPPDVYIMLGDSIKFQIIHMNNGQMDFIPLPNSQFYLDIESKTIGSIDVETGEVTALEAGNTRVVLQDRNVEPGSKLPSATVHVVTPEYMVLSILPHRNWAVLLSEYHDIVAEVFTSNDNKIHLGKGVEVLMQVTEIFHVEERSQNGSWLTGWATEVGFAPVKAHLKMDKISLDQEITAHAQLNIYAPIVLKPSEVVLPWDPQRRPKYEKQIIATGGDGRFLWTSSNHTLGVVTQTGYVRTHTLGQFEVSAAMMKNHHNRETVLFRILTPIHLEIVEFVMEAEVGTPIYIHVAMFANKISKSDDSPSQIPFTHCQDMPFKVKLSNSNFVQNKSSCVAAVGISCANIAIIGSEVGMSTVSVSYLVDGKITLEDTVSVNTFKPLKMIHPKICEIVLAVGTSINVLFEGGPQPVPGKQSLHQRIITSKDESVVEASEDTESEKPGEILVVVRCLAVGESEIKLSISNSPVVPNSKNRESTAKVKVVCGTPESLSLTPEAQSSPTCPMDLSSRRVVVQSYKDIELDVIVTDQLGRKFLNISSLKFDWSVTPAELGEIKNLDGVFTKEILIAGLKTSNKSFQVVSPKSQRGSIEVAATIVSYKMDYLIEQGIKLPIQEELSPVSSGIHLFLVDDTLVIPNETSIFNHPGNRRTLSVQQGSGYFEMGLSQNDIANVKYLENTHEIEIIPLKDGHLRITLLDLCLTSTPSVIQANVVSVSTIRVEMSDKVEIGRCISCVVKLYDNSDKLLSIPNLSMINIESDIEHDIIKLKRVKEEPNSLPCGEMHYIITGVELGSTKLSFSIGTTSSIPIDLQVFSPLDVTPKNTTLIVGAVLQLGSKGGPQPDCIVEYSSEDNSILDVSIGGLAKAQGLGKTKIIARATGINPTTGLKVIYSQDSVDISVIPLVGIKIGAPLTRFMVSRTVPIWVNGIPEQLTPMILGTAEPSLKFEWTLNEEEVVSLQSPFKEYGITYSPDDNIVMRLTGLSAGKTSLTLTATVPGIVAGKPSTSNVTYSSSIDVEVFESLFLTQPNNVTGSFILMAPHSTLQIQTNLDGSNKLRYSLPGPEVPKDSNVKKSLSVPNSLVTLSESGLLSSHGLFGKTMLLITALDEYGLKQTLSLIVEIKPVHYMLLNIIAKWQINTALGALSVVPTGTEFQLQVTYHDDTGAKFTSGSSELAVRSSRFDLIRIRPGVDNSSLCVSVRQKGDTMIKVWADGFHKTADYIKIHSGSGIYPAEDTLTTGDVLCLCTRMVDENGESGSWSSSDSSILDIDAKTGVGRVEGKRGGSVAVRHSLQPTAALVLKVIPANQVTMIHDKSKPLINSQDAPAYSVPLVLSLEGNTVKTSNVICQCSCDEPLFFEELPTPHRCFLEFSGASCSLDTKDIFNIEPGFDAEKGQYVCKITAGIPTTPAISTLRSNISVWAELIGNEVAAPPVELNFIPAIYVNPELLIDKNSQAQLQIHGLDFVLKEVFVEPYDKNVIKITGPEVENEILKFQVTLLDYHEKFDQMGQAMDIIVKSKVTSEIKNVHVKIGDAGRRASGRASCDVQPSRHGTGSGDDYQNTLISMATMIGVLAITYLIYTVYFQPVVNVNVQPGPQATENQCAYVRYMQRTQGVSGSPRYSGSDSRNSPRRFM